MSDKTYKDILIDALDQDKDPMLFQKIGAVVGSVIGIIMGIVVVKNTSDILEDPDTEDEDVEDQS